MLSTAFLTPPHAHQVLIFKTGMVFRQQKQGWVRSRLGEAGQADDEQSKATPSCQAQPRVCAGIWLWPGRSEVGGGRGVGLGSQPKWEAARAEMSPSPGVGAEEQAGCLQLSTLRLAGEAVQTAAHSQQGPICRPAEQTNPRHPLLVPVKGPESHTRS